MGTEEPIKSVKWDLTLHTILLGVFLLFLRLSFYISSAIISGFFPILCGPSGGGTEES